MNNRNLEQEREEFAARAITDFEGALILWQQGQVLLSKTDRSDLELIEAAIGMLLQGKSEAA